MSNEINKDRNPTPADLKILAWLEAGQSINNVEAISKFQNAMLRDAIWRLKKAGYPITAEWVNYKTKEGKKKKFKKYYITPPEILKAGDKTEKGYKKGEKTFIDYANAVIEKSQKYGVEQTSMFPNYQKALETQPKSHFKVPSLDSNRFWLTLYQKSNNMKILARKSSEEDDRLKKEQESYRKEESTYWWLLVLFLLFLLGITYWSVFIWKN